mgnify:CR=1 FL=1
MAFGQGGKNTGSGFGQAGGSYSGGRSGQLASAEGHIDWCKADPKDYLPSPIFCEPPSWMDLGCFVTVEAKYLKQIEVTMNAACNLQNTLKEKLKTGKAHSAAYLAHCRAECSNIAYLPLPPYAQPPTGPNDPILGAIKAYCFTQCQDNYDAQMEGHQEVYDLQMSQIDQHLTEWFAEIAEEFENKAKDCCMSPVGGDFGNLPHGPIGWDVYPVPVPP